VSGRVTVRIDRLVLSGVRPSDRRAVSRALTVELARLLTERGVPVRLTRPASIDRLAARPATARGGSSARGVGRSVASALYRALEGSR
jgi:hypothetical protein